VSGDKKQDGSTPQQGSNGTRSSGSSRNVSTWASLFQEDDEVKRMEGSGIGEYSCLRLLKEMEALEQEEEDELESMDQDENELVTMHVGWCEKIAECMRIDGLPENLYTIPVVEDPPQEVQMVEVRAEERQQKMDAGKWGPTLVEKRPTRGQRDGKTILEKAQERKIINLEKPKGIPLSLYSLSNFDPVDASSVARVIGVSSGVDQISCDKSVLEVLECNRARVAEFEGGCEKCQKDQSDLLDRSNVDSRGREMTLKPPLTKISDLSGG
jgi:hypothetical protein